MLLFRPFLRATLVVFVFTGVVAFGQEKKPEAYLRVSYECAKWVAVGGRITCETFKPQAEAKKFFSIEIYMPVRLAEAAYNRLKDASAGNADKPVLGALFADDTEMPEAKVEISQNDPPLPGSLKGDEPPSNFSRTRFVIYLPREIDTTRNFTVSLYHYPVDVAGGGTRERRFNVAVKKEFTTTLTTKADPGACYDQLTTRVTYDNEEDAIFPQAFGGVKLAPLKQIPLKYLADPTLPATAAFTAADIDASQYKAYAMWRTGVVYDWLNKLKNNPSGLARVQFRIEDVRVLLKPAPELGAVEDNGVFILPDKSIWQPKETDLPLFTAVAGNLAPEKQEDPENDRQLFACFKTDKSLPNGDFNAIMRFNGTGAPPELVPVQAPVVAPALPPIDIVKTGIKGPTSEVGPGLPDPSTKIGERPIEKDLDISGSYTRALEEKDEKDPADATKTIKTRRYISRGTLDAILRPFGKRPQICRPISLFSCDPILESTDRTAVYRSFTPFFIDARVSTGKITKDTLSLNRIVLGTEGEYRYVLRNDTYPTFFRFIGRFVNASDRDFKQAEYKGTFEFRPVWAAINHPLSSMSTRQNAVITDSGNKADPQKQIPSERGGYEFIPFFGAELGRTWARRNPAEAVEPSNAVKRLYFGLDITLNPFKRTTVTLTDSFYFKYESKDDRRDNYFKGNVDFLIGKFFGVDRLGHSIFFSFERGQLPPFNDPGVSALKFGYRIAGTSVFRRVGNF